MKERGSPGDYVLIQGDFGAVYIKVNFAFSVDLIPVYSTTEREVVEKAMPDNTVRSGRVFRYRRNFLEIKALREPRYEDLDGCLYRNYLVLL